MFLPNDLVSFGGFSAIPMFPAIPADTTNRTDPWAIPWYFFLAMALYHRYFCWQFPQISPRGSPCPGQCSQPLERRGAWASLFPRRYPDRATPLPPPCTVSTGTAPARRSPACPALPSWHPSLRMTGASRRGLRGSPAAPYRPCGSVPVPAGPVAAGAAAPAGPGAPGPGRCLSTAVQGCGRSGARPAGRPGPGLAARRQRPPAPREGDRARREPPPAPHAAREAAPCAEALPLAV